MTIYGADISNLPARERERIATNLEFNLADMEKAAEKMFGKDGLLSKIGIDNIALMLIRERADSINIWVKDIVKRLRTEEGT